MLKHCKIRTIDSNNCQYMFRKVKKDSIGRTIICTGRYAFDYTIHIVDRQKKTVLSIKFSNRATALKEYNKYK